MDFEILADESSLAPVLERWDELAVQNALPMSAPGWMLGWWRHMRPDRARLRVVAVRERGEVVAIAPFFVVVPRSRAGRVDYRLLSAGHGEGLTPLARPGGEWDVAPVLAQALAQCDPRPDLVAFEATPLRSIWPVLLRERWPGARRPSPMRPTVSGASSISLEHESFEHWLAGLDSKTRAEARRRRRRLEEAGGTIRWSTQVTLQEDLEAVLRLHTSRWEGRGESALVGLRDSAIAAFEEMGREGLDGGRLRVQVIELDGEPISAHVILACGGTVVSLNGGWDERFKALSPPTLRVLATVEDAIARGDRRLSLGNGVQAYKQRFANEDEPLAWGELLAPGPRRLLTRTRMAPGRLRRSARDTAKRTLGEGGAQRVRSLRGRLS